MEYRRGDFNIWEKRYRDILNMGKAFIIWEKVEMYYRSTMGCYTVEARYF